MGGRGENASFYSKGGRGILGMASYLWYSLSEVERERITETPPPRAFATRALIQRAEKVCKLWCDSRYKEGIRSGFFVVLFFSSLALTFIKHRGVIVHRHQTISRMHLMAERISCENLDLKAFASV